MFVCLCVYMEMYAGVRVRAYAFCCVLWNKLHTLCFRVDVSMKCLSVDGGLLHDNVMDLGMPVLPIACVCYVWRTLLKTAV